MVFSAYRQTSAYGWRTHPVTGKRNSFHAGIDLVKSHKAAIKAFTSGKVVYAGFGNSGTGLGGYGNVVLVKDSNGRGQLYAHLDSVSVRTGQSINKGQVIGRQGATGQVTGSHLHYEVRKKTSPSYGWTSNKQNSTVDPTNYLKKYVEVNGSILDAQRWLNSYSFNNIKEDGIAGPETFKAAVKVYQHELNKQFYVGLTVDGVPGPKTDAAAITIRKGAKGNLTKVLQVFLLLKGYSLALDGDFGKETYRNVRSFQRDQRLSIDGSPGKQTFRKLIRR